MNSEITYYIQSGSNSWSHVLGIFLDTETNGLNFFTHKVLEIACEIIDVSTGKKVATFHRLIAPSAQEWAASDPESLKINGFTWDEVSQGQSANAVTTSLKTLFSTYDLSRSNAIFICQNPSFDRAFFSQLIDSQTQEKLLFPYHWLDLASMFWAQSIANAREHGSKLPWETGYSKDKIAQFYGIGAEEKPHRAQNGVKHLISCYQAVVGFPCEVI